MKHLRVWTAALVTIGGAATAMSAFAQSIAPGEQELARLGLAPSSIVTPTTNLLTSRPFEPKQPIRLCIEEVEVVAGPGDLDGRLACMIARDRLQRSCKELQKGQPCSSVITKVELDPNPSNDALPAVCTVTGQLKPELVKCIPPGGVLAF